MARSHRRHVQKNTATVRVGNEVSAHSNDGEEVDLALGLGLRLLEVDEHGKAGPPELPVHERVVPARRMHTCQYYALALMPVPRTLP